MGQSLGNYIGIEEEPSEMFGKTMSLPDEAMEHWFQLAVDFDPDRVSQVMGDVASGSMHPNLAKRLLARSVVALYHGDAAAAAAETQFDQVFKHGGVPKEIDSFPVPAGETVNLPALIRDAFGGSGSDARRLLQQGAVRVNGDQITDQEVDRKRLVGQVLQVGKRKFIRLVN
jgi:tyrosyl-tRNA synthetase